MEKLFGQTTMSLNGKVVSLEQQIQQLSVFNKKIVNFTVYTSAKWTTVYILMSGVC